MADEMLALTLPLDVVERLLVMAQWADYQMPNPNEEDCEIIKLVEREIEQVQQAAKVAGRA